MSSAVTLHPSYGFFTVTTQSVELPFPHWQQVHCDQGFAWMPGSVSFGLDGDPITIPVTVMIQEGCGEFAADAARVIRVPFDVGEEDQVQLAVVAGPQDDICIPPGKYTLQFELGIAGGDATWCTLRFCPPSGTAEIVRADSGLRPPPTLVMEATPAITSGAT